MDDPLFMGKNSDLNKTPEINWAPLDNSHPLVVAVAVVVADLLMLPIKYLPCPPYPCPIMLPANCHCWYPGCWVGSFCPKIPIKFPAIALGSIQINLKKILFCMYWASMALPVLSN